MTFDAFSYKRIMNRVFAVSVMTTNLQYMYVDKLCVEYDLHFNSLLHEKRLSCTYFAQTNDSVRIYER